MWFFRIVILSVIYAIADSNVKISGKIVNQLQLPISGAEVRLSNPSLIDTTDAEGVFKLVKKTTSLISGMEGNPFKIKQNPDELMIHSFKRLENFKLEILDVSGKIFFTMQKPTLPPGNHSFQVPYPNLQSSQNLFVKVNYQDHDIVNQKLIFPLTKREPAKGFQLTVTHPEYQALIKTFEQAEINLGTIVMVQADSPPAAPANLVARGETAHSIRLNWEDQSDNESFFIIHRGTFKFDRGNSLNGSIDWTSIDTIQANRTEYLYSNNLTPGTKYYFRLQAGNSNELSKFSDTVSTETKLVSVTVSDGSLNDLKELSPHLDFDTLVITGNLNLPKEDVEVKINANNFKLDSTGSITNIFEC